MTSHQVYSNQDVRSPKKETQKMNVSIICEDSPTGIMGFPDDGTPYGKPVVLRPGVPTIQALHHPEETAEQELERRCAFTAQYWANMEQELISGRKDFLVPSCYQPFQGFSVSEGFVQHMILKWNMFFQPSLPTLLTPLTTMPGANVLNLVEFYNNYAQQRMQHEAMEPFLVYKTISEAIRGRVAELEDRCVFHPPTWTFNCPLRHVSAKIQPLVTWWNTEAFKVVPTGPVEETGSHRSPRVVVMANLMQKKLEHMDEKAKASHAPSPMDTTPFLVLQMASLLEDMNCKTKTGLYDDSPMDTKKHAHHFNSLPMVY
mmetsp:Transcript_15346/g.31193  ORF Transcript_15346/g.31193 Transcript_15346/m.31193 type:complete len:316 (-) Transcript_15346:126-1073(-)